MHTQIKRGDCMNNRPSAKTKVIRKMGQGTGADYKPYITTSEFNSQGTTSVKLVELFTAYLREKCIGIIFFAGMTRTLM